MTTKNYILKTLKSNKRRFSKLGITSIGLFGSYIRNEQSKDSDIDLLIDFDPEKENFENYMAVYDLFEQLFKMKSRSRYKKWFKSLYRTKNSKRSAICIKIPKNT